jgi:hypothetical protein
MAVVAYLTTLAGHMKWCCVVSPKHVVPSSATLQQGQRVGMDYLHNSEETVSHAHTFTQIYVRRVVDMRCYTKIGLLQWAR